MPALCVCFEPLRRGGEIRFLNDGPGGMQCVTNDKTCSAGVLPRYRPQEQRFFLGPNP